MASKEAFGEALRELRLKKGLTQEDFSELSSRTYLSTLERGLKSPTLEKVEQLASVLDIHPLALLTLYYLKLQPHTNLSDLQQIVVKHLK